jgi:hypothetical protein
VTAQSPPQSPPPAGPTVNVSADKIDQILAALRNVATALADNAAQGDGRGFLGVPTKPSPVQAGTIVDYTALSQLLGRPGFVGVVSAERQGNKIVFKNAPPDATKALVQADRDPEPEVVELDPPTPGSKDRTVTLRRIGNDRSIGRTELRTSDDIPIRVGPRLRPSP